MLEPPVAAAEIENAQGFSRIEYPEKSHHATSFHLPLGGVTSSNVPEGKILQIRDVGTSPAGLLPSQPVRIGKCAKARTVRFPNEHRDIACHGEFMTLAASKSPDVKRSGGPRLLRQRQEAIRTCQDLESLRAHSDWQSACPFNASPQSPTSRLRNLGSLNVQVRCHGRQDCPWHRVCLHRENRLRRGDDHLAQVISSLSSMNGCANFCAARPFEPALRRCPITMSDRPGARSMFSFAIFHAVP